MTTGRPLDGYVRLNFDDISLQEVRSLISSIGSTSELDSSESDGLKTQGLNQRHEVQSQQSTSHSATRCDKIQLSDCGAGLLHDIHPQRQTLELAANINRNRKLGVTQHKERLKFLNRLIQMGWWWELASTLLSLICMSLIVAILLYMDDQSYEKWKLPIQANSLVAVFSTISKSALLYPLAKCIGQLKWEYFDTARPRLLSELHAFDTASRGPWGAFKLIWITRGKATLASLAAFITVLMLAFEPFAQQIILPSARNVLMRNETASVLVTNTWSSPNPLYKVLLDLPIKGDYDKVTYPLTAGIMASVINPMPLEPVSSYCPTSQCKFQDFTTLGACSECTSEVVNNNYFDECRYTVSLNDGNITLFNLVDFRNEVRQHLDRPVQDRDNDISVVGLVECDKYVNKDVDPNEGIRMVLAISLQIIWPMESQNRRPSAITMRTKYFSQWDHVWYQAWEDNPTSPEAEKLNSPILQIYSPSSSAEMNPHYRSSSRTEIMSFHGFNSTTDLRLYTEIEQMGVINGTLSQCQIKFCAHTHKEAVIDNGRWSTLKVEETPLNSTGFEAFPNRTLNDPRTNFTYDAASIEDTFRIGNSSFLPLEQTIRTIFDSEEFEVAMHNELYNGTANGDWNIVSKRIAAVISSVVQSPRNPEARNFTGDAYGQEIFVHVRWIWLSGPLFIVTLSIVLLIITIITSSRKQYLFKTSILAVLFHGLEGWYIADSQTETDGRKKTDVELLKIAKGMRVSLLKNEEGSLKLKKE